MSDFVHLHNHTDYSLLDAAQSVDMMINRVGDIGMDTIAVTEHGNLFSLIPFYKQAKKAGIKPILGCEVYVAAGEHDQKTYNVGNNKWGYYHLVLIAQNNIGYRNLMKLTTIGYLNGFYYKPRVDKNLLKKYNEGLIATSACLAGEVTSYAVRGDYESAKKAALDHLEIFDDRFYLELQKHGIEEEEKARPILVKLSKELNIPLVATNDNHYSLKEHSDAHDILFCCGMGKFKSDTDRHRYEHEQFYIKSADEMYDLFKKYPSAIENTLKIAESCDVDIPLGEIHLPEFPIPAESSNSPDEYLENLCMIGLKDRYRDPSPVIIDRLKYELSVIKKMGFAGYFLITQDFVKYAKDSRIPVGPGRGSAVGSIVSYCLGITNVDPMKYNLIFERFLNPHRVTMPDIDIDFCIEGREKVIQYIKERYGEDSVAQIITFGTMKAKGSIRDVGRVLGMDYGEVDRVAKLIPNEPKMTLKKAMSVNQEFKDIVNKSDIHKQLIENSTILEGMHRHASTHAAGIVITPGSLTDHVPLYKSANSKDIATQYEMGSLEDLGLLKMDFLGLRNLTVIDKTIKAIKSNHGVDIDIESINLNDQKVYSLFSKGKTVGVFQFESSGMQEYLKKLNPTRIEDLIAMNSLYRPGPMKNIPTFISRKEGSSPISYVHPSLEPILKETYGIIVYQEQVMQIGLDIGGLSLPESDEMRRAMGKKKKKLMATFKIKFIDGAAKKGIDKKIAIEIFDLLEKFAEYGFNKSHSAAYSIIAYQTAWLKTYYPSEFHACNMSSEYGDTDRLAVLINDAKNHNINILPPCVNKSETFFKANTNGDIHYGLSAIKNVGTKSSEKIVENRKNNSEYKNIFDLCSIESKAVNKKILENLILSGACDELEGNRLQKFKSIELALKFGQKLNNSSNSAQSSLFGGESAISISTPKLVDSDEFKNSELINHEKAAIGFYLMSSPLDKHKDDLINLSNVGIGNNKEKDILKAGGIIQDVKLFYDKNNNQWGIITLECLFGTAELFVFSNVYEKFRNILHEDSKIFIIGKKSTRGEFDSNNPKIIVDKIYTLDSIMQTLSKTINIKIPFHYKDPNILSIIKGTVALYPGSCPIFLYLENSNKEFDKIQLSKIKLSASKECVDYLTDKLVKATIKIGI